MCLNAHHELTNVNIYSVMKKEDTGKHKLDNIIEQIMTGMDYNHSALIPIYDAYNAVQLTKGCTAWQLREAIRSRLIQENLISP